MSRCLGCLATVSPLLPTSLSVAQDMPLSQVLIDEEGWRLVAEGSESIILKLGADGKPEAWPHDIGKASGPMLDPETKKVVWYDRNAQPTGSDEPSRTPSVPRPRRKSPGTDVGQHQRGIP